MRGRDATVGPAYEGHTAARVSHAQVHGCAFEEAPGMAATMLLLFGSNLIHSCQVNEEIMSRLAGPGGALLTSRASCSPCLA
mmetsp:Transcript_2334/g.7512  ORF Transcript_2334/g.7512 Transcript_2334/m.7512 type:complete len:82 (-) Transcript_2334:253-498(-)